MICILFLDFVRFAIGLSPITIINYQTVTSCFGLARSYYVATVGVNNKPVQNMAANLRSRALKKTPALQARKSLERSLTGSRLEYLEKSSAWCKHARNGQGKLHSYLNFSTVLQIYVELP